MCQFRPRHTQQIFEPVLPNQLHFHVGFLDCGLSRPVISVTKSSVNFCNRRLEFQPFSFEMVDYYCLVRLGPVVINWVSLASSCRTAKRPFFT